MQRNVHHAHEDNEHAGAILRQLNVNDVNTPLSSPCYETETLRTKQAGDSSFHRTLAQWQSRLDRENGSNETVAMELELQSANDRILQLERQLLDAEETICHLKAEKLEAKREIEQLRRGTLENATCSQENDSDLQRVVLELETKVDEQKKTHALEEQQLLAVIQDKESALKMLRGQVEDGLKQFEELQKRHIDLLELDEEESLKQDEETSDKSQVSMYQNDDDEAEGSTGHATGRSRAPADADAVNPTWQEELVRHPTPQFDMKSPEVACILQAWTNNLKKIRSLRRWLVEVVATKGPLPKEFPMVVELPRLRPEVRDGFLTLIVPLLRKQTELKILAHSRQYNDGIHSDLRIRVVPRQ
ncbi:hypothetical protein PsorP6_006897 [Peronosclerospora sorghi]|uniref:Uncharacterized protein n=1 Tax=Peronosclerospora sorghi TaxID=230839 RepID=A0ACC0WBE3_9STRA|nr:hypothetical protein PsorP6_006897 [Peronosclerospora sorghi]